MSFNFNVIFTITLSMQIWLTWYFSLQYQYIIKQTGDDSAQTHQPDNMISSYHLVSCTNPQENLWLLMGIFSLASFYI